MSLNKLPREILCEIIAKQNSIEYFNADECQLLIKKAKKRLTQISFDQFKEFFPLSENFYKLSGIDIIFEHNGIKLESEEGFIFIYENKNGESQVLQQFFDFYQNSDKKLMDGLGDFIKQNRESSYKFLQSLEKNAIDYKIEIDFP